MTSIPVTETSFIDTDFGSIDPAEQYRYAVETIYVEGESEFTFSNIVDGNLLGISDEELSGMISVYPVPAIDVLYIETNTSFDASSEILLYNVLGQLVNRIDTSNQGNRITLDVSQLSNGIYFLKIQKDGAISNKKFMVGH